MLDKELKKIIEDKNFKNFWETYDYLLLSGYSELEGFGICLEIFNENKIWDDVAFVSYEFNSENQYPWDNNSTDKHQITIGLINKDTEHLRKLFRFYMESCVNDVMIFDIVKEVKDFENLCNEKYNFKLPKIILEYLKHTSEKHYGFDVFNNKQSKYILEKNTQYSIEYPSYTTTTTKD
tara:strand:+ start:100 stop:636 length:537 start_codon:yes stop_codon:yes gene_type:complete